MKKTKALAVLEEVAASLRESAETASVNSSFDEGRLIGYYEALSTLVSQCDIAGIGLSEIGLSGFTPESILRAVNKKAA
jgi:hypothetical protein